MRRFFFVDPAYKKPVAGPAANRPADGARNRASFRWLKRPLLHGIAISSVLLSGFLLGLPDARAQNAPPDPDLQKQDVPHGTVTRFTMKNSQVYPGAEHNVTVYVPAQYDKSKPACVMLFQDGLGFNAPTVFDNLIAKKQMPVTIAIGVNPGVAPPSGANPANALPRFNRSVEYDTPDDTYARFLLDEVLPEVGKTYNLSRDPNDRGLCGGSSGGIAAFTAAWERPDQFRRVYCVIGSFTDLAGGDTYPSKIRKYEPRPLRVFLQDNDRDQDIYSGSWPLANQEVAAALKYAGYDSQFVVGQGGHDGRPGSLIFPEAMRWLWRDYPAPIAPQYTSSRQTTMQFILPGEDWQEVPDETALSLTAGANGDVYFTEADGTTIRRLGADGQTALLHSDKGEIYALAVAPDGRLIAAANRGLMAYDAQGRETPFAQKVRASNLVISHAGMVYYTDRRDGRLGLLDKDGRKHKMQGVSAEAQSAADSSLPAIPPEAALTLSPDQSLLITTGGGPRKALVSWRLLPDGTPTDGEPFFDLTIPYGQMGTGAAALATDTRGWLYVATPAGIQVCDQAGRVNGILGLPRNFTPSEMTFGGKERDWLFVSNGRRLYKRKLRVRGVLPFEEPIKPPPTGL